MPKIAIVAALEREVSSLIEGRTRVARQHEGRSFAFFERKDWKDKDKDRKDKDRRDSGRRDRDRDRDKDRRDKDNDNDDCNNMVIVCGGIGVEAARRAAEAVIALYRPTFVQSVGFAGALDSTLHVGDIFSPAVVVDARDGSRVEIEGGNKHGTLVTFMAVAGIDQKVSLARAYGARAVDMEAAAVAAAARAHAIPFAATKAISDEYDFEMPQTARFIDSQGRFRTASFAIFAALRPWLWKRVVQLAGNSHKAGRALGEHLHRLEKEPSPASQEILSPAAGASSSGGHE